MVCYEDDRSNLEKDLYVSYMFPFLNTSMLRERFVITSKGNDGDKEPVIALGNRIIIPLKGADGRLVEHFIIRGHNMHCVCRIAAKLFQDFNRTGPILARLPKYDWTGAWRQASSSYEEAYNDKNWICVYHKGRKVFSIGDFHPFLDVIEQCDATNRDDYDRATKIAEDAFLQAGKAVQIVKETTIAAVIGVTDKKARCGLIFRNPKHSTTFNFTLMPQEIATARDPKPAEPHICMNMCAAFLEGIQLAFTVGKLNYAVEANQLTKASAEYRQAQAAQRRIGRLNSEIKNYENMYDATYRPEQPDLFMVIKDSQEVVASYAKQQG